MFIKQLNNDCHGHYLFSTYYVLCAYRNLSFNPRNNIAGVGILNLILELKQ